jgi:hypothetical protein
VVERGAGDPKRADTFTVWCEATAAAVAIDDSTIRLYSSSRARGERARQKRVLLGLARAYLLSSLESPLVD